ncbi:cytochrome C oxidase subunit IV family protein [uncultured Tenacibaculum sp.]|uniref:cytochrome C oxidase subunit IV family protein n=1 Tax=uncultured Tenacibaculum sp. TaxID=174713 RepID=UPI00262C11B1|nr:cytochrome C oxidase subunit IV family protein [uncultured Tenacibaculum sp.]
MNKSTIITWVSLLLLIIISTLFSTIENSLFVYLIIGLAAIKFLGVAFQFMELKKAHSFWKIAILCFLFIFTVLVLSIL